MVGHTGVGAVGGCWVSSAHLPGLKPTDGGAGRSCEGSALSPGPPEPLLPDLLCLYSRHPPAQPTHLFLNLKKFLTPLLQAVFRAWGWQRQGPKIPV